MGTKVLTILGALLLAESMAQTTEVGGSTLTYCRYVYDPPPLPMFFIRTLVCENMMSEKHLDDDLITIVGPKAERLRIVNSSLRYLLHNSFVGMEFKEIFIIDSDLLALSDTDVAFEGLERYMEKLIAINTSFVAHWDWNHLRNLQTLRDITIVDSDLMELAEDTTRIPRTVMSLNFRNNRISWVHPNAFAHLQTFMFLSLERNEISSLQRSMFPNPANVLWALHLGHNSLSTLPPDMFQNMPKLEVLSLDHNQLHTIDERVFGSVINNYLELVLDGNPMMCDCRMKWLTKLDLKLMYITGNCSSPSHLVGRHVTELKPQELWC